MRTLIDTDLLCLFFFFQAEDGIRDSSVTGVQTCALPISAWTPGVSLIRSPGRASVIGSDYHRATEIVSRAATSAPHITESENSSRNRRSRCNRPRLTAVTRSCSARVIGIAGIQITAAYDPMERITESDCEGTREGSTEQRRVIRIPRVALVSGGQYSGNRRDACRYPRVPTTFCCAPSPP